MTRKTFYEPYDEPFWELAPQGEQSPAYMLNSLPIPRGKHAGFGLCRGSP